MKLQCESAKVQKRSLVAFINGQQKAGRILVQNQIRCDSNNIRYHVTSPFPSFVLLVEKVSSKNRERREDLLVPRFLFSRKHPQLPPSYGEFSTRRLMEK